MGKVFITDYISNPDIENKVLGNVAMILTILISRYYLYGTKSSMENTWIILKI